MNDRRSYLILLGLILAALIGVAFLALPGSPVQRKPHLGLDLQGGLEVVLKAVPPKGRQLTSSDVDRSIGIMRNRIDKLGVASPEIRKQGSNQIVIELAGVKNPQAAAAIIGKTAQLQFYDLEADLLPPSIDAQGFPVATPSLYALLSRVQSTAGKNPEGWYVFNRLHKQVVGPVDTKAQALKRYGGTLPKGYSLFAVPTKTTVITCGPPAVDCPGINATPTTTSYYLFKYDPPAVPEMTGSDLVLGGTRADFDPSGNPIVLMQFTGKGGQLFHKITRIESQRGRLRSSLIGQDVMQHFAVVLDGQIQTWPQINFHDLPDGIAGNSAQITGIGSIGEAKSIALVLQTGALPVNFVQIERTDVSATLGKDSLNQAMKAALIGLLLVAIFLLVLYRFLGLVAVIGLGIYVAFLYAAILLLNVTLTLPGFAGMILTIGVAADANVVVFERIKEEVRAGKSVRAGIATGYAKGFHTILDANVVTCITALVLFAVATAEVKGFALMLLIGTVISLLTAVFATRAMLGLLAGFKWFDSPRLMGAHGAQTGKWLQIDFMKRRRTWFAISGTVIAISVVALGVKGLNLGIDFKGGTQVTFKTTQPTSVAKVRAVTAKNGFPDAVIQGTGGSQSGGYKGFQIRTKALNGPQLTQLQSSLATGVGATAAGATTVSSSFGSQIARLAITAVIVSLLLIILYITIRFDLKYAVPVILALVHDIIITVGIYALTGFEVSTATVAAVLTVLGYSIYDTIIIFDRIRENAGVMRRSSFATIANISLWETIRRSLATTFITLLPIASLLLFGGATLKDFAFALLIGITSGAYSSIFIAAPLLTTWKEREPDYARLKGQEMPATVAAREELVEEAEAEMIAAEDAPVEAAAAVTTEPSSDSKRAKRQQRRKSRPHGRAR
jgi:SecD/SecF fusion protein